jgi:dTDP-4-amino-4,6-dideoxygalactose transaminase
MTVEEYEKLIATRGGWRGAVLASRATVGLAAVLKSLALPRGSGVLVPVMLCANVVHAVRGAGLEPVFVDMEVGDLGFGIDLAKAERVVEARQDVRALLAVPLFGGGLDVDGLAGIAKRHGLAVVEDAAQRGMRNPRTKDEGGMRNSSRATVYSFGAGKIADAGGGAAIVSDDLGLLAAVREELSARKDLVEIAGRILRSLDGLEDELAGRRMVAEGYRESLPADSVEHPGGELPSWKYSLLLRDRWERDRVTRRLLENGVAASNLYVPLSRWFGGYSEREWGRGDFPVAWDISERIVNLPLWPVHDGLLADVLRALDVKPSA